MDFMNKNSVFPEDRPRHHSLERSPANSFTRPAHLEPAPSSSRRNDDDFPKMVDHETGFMKFMPTNFLHKKNLNERSNNPPDYAHDMSQTNSFLERQRHFIRENRMCSIIVGCLVGILIICLIISIILLIFLPRKNNNMTSTLDSTKPKTTSTTSSPMPTYPTGVVSSTSTLSFLLNSTIDPDFESFLPFQRQSNSYLAYLNDTLVIIQPEISNIQPELQVLYVSLDRDSCSKCSVLDVKDDCRTNISAENFCNESYLIYCCTECNRIDYTSFCKVYGNMYKSIPKLLLARLYLDNQILQLITVDGFNNNFTNPHNKDCQLFLANFNNGWQFSGGFQCYSDPQNVIPSSDIITAATTRASSTLTWRSYLTFDGTLKVDNFVHNFSYFISNFANKSEQYQLKMEYNPTSNSYTIVSFSGNTFSVARIVQKNATDITFEYLHPLEFKYQVGFGELGGWFIEDGTFFIWYKSTEPENRIYLSKFEFLWPS